MVANGGNVLHKIDEWSLALRRVNSVLKDTIHALWFTTATNKHDDGSTQILPGDDCNIENNAPSCALLIEANSQYVFFHEINATNLCRHPWRSKTEYVLICLILR